MRSKSQAVRVHHPADGRTRRQARAERAEATRTVAQLVGGTLIALVALLVAFALPAAFDTLSLRP